MLSGHQSGHRGQRQHSSSNPSNRPYLHLAEPTSLHSPATNPCCTRPDPSNPNLATSYPLLVVILLTLTITPQLYDKQEAMVAKGLELNKFPHPESMLTSRCKYGVITSQLHRYEVACSSKPAFMVSAVKLYSEYLDKGYSQRHTNRYFRSFITRHMPRCHPKCVQQEHMRQSR